MEHNDSQERPESMMSLLGTLGITDDMEALAPPAWVAAPLTDEQRAVLSRMAIQPAQQETFMPPQALGVLLFKLALQPNLPPQAAGFLALNAAALVALTLVEKHTVRERGTVRGIGIEQARTMVDETDVLVTPVADEDQDQDAGTELGVGA